MNLISDIRDGLSRLDHSRRELQKFGVTIAVALALLSALLFFYGNHPLRSLSFAGVAFSFLAAAFFAPHMLKFIRIAWMGLALFLGFFMSRLLLSLVFYLLMTPIRFILFLFGKDILHEKIALDKESYWIKVARKEKSAEDYNKLY